MPNFRDLLPPPPWDSFPGYYNPNTGMAIDRHGVQYDPEVVREARQKLVDQLLSQVEALRKIITPTPRYLELGEWGSIESSLMVLLGNISRIGKETEQLTNEQIASMVYYERIGRP